VLPWIDTGTVTTADLRASQVLVMAGPMKSGKSREAVELLRRAVAEGIVSPARLYDVSESWRSLPPDALKAELQSRLDFGSPVVLYLNQLPLNASEKEIEALDVLRDAVRRCNGGRLVATARSEHLANDRRMQEWLKGEGRSVDDATAG
jgi:hypothetical protein